MMTNNQKYAMDALGDWAKDLRGCKVLVSGATGLLGRHLVIALLDNGAQVIALGRNENKLKRCYKEMLDNENLLLLSGNLINGVPAQIEKIDYIFHAAGSISGSVIREKPIEIIESNIVGLRNCLEYIRKQGHGRVIVFSSATVYGNRFEGETEVIEEDTSLCEPLYGENIAYSESKRMCEVLATAYSKQFDVEVVIARLSYVYGYANPAPQTAFYSFIDSALDGADIVIQSAGLPCRDNIYVEDAVSGLLTIAIKGRKGEAYNISSNGDLNNYKAMDQIANIISDISKEKGISAISVKVSKNDSGRKPGMKMNNDKLKALGWNVLTDISLGIEKTLMCYVNEKKV